MKILWAKSELLHPVDKGGKIRTYEMLRQLRKSHEVTYICLASPDDPQDSYDRATEYCQHLITVPWSTAPRFSAGFYADLVRNVVSPFPYVIDKYRSRKMYEIIEREEARGAFDVIVCDFLSPSRNVPRRTRAARVLFEHNVESMLWERQYKNQTNPAKFVYFFGQYAKLWAYEGWQCHIYDAVAAVSENDAAEFRSRFKLKDVYAVPTGVDTEFFSPLPEVAAGKTAAHDGGSAPKPPARPLQPPREMNDLVFTGSMDWMPNEDAILWLADAILPRIAAEVPDVKVTVVGRNPTPALQRLAERDSRIHLTGRVDDVRPYIARSAVYVVPMRVGGGTRIKIYEAMGMERAVVSTTIGAEGLPVKDGEEIVLADDAGSFASRVVELMRDEPKRARIEAAARRAVVARFGWDRAADAFVGICERALAKHVR